MGENLSKPICYATQINHNCNYHCSSPKLNQKFRILDLAYLQTLLKRIACPANGFLAFLTHHFSKATSCQTGLKLV
jgi:hypothetical protein